MGVTPLALGKRILAGLGAVALASAGLFGAATAANADDLPDLGNINFEATGSITIHKHAQPETDGPVGDGSVLDPAPGNPLQGVQFSVQPVTSIDLTDPAVWDTLENLDPNDSTLTFGETVGPQVTGAQGTTTFDNLGVGVYLVTEGENTGESHIVKKAEPFFVVIPSNINNQWVYGIHAYPKNSVATLEKTVEDADARVPGDLITWPIAATMPTLAEGDSIDAVSIEDTIDDRLAFLAFDGGAIESAVQNVTYDGTALAAGDYNVDITGQKLTFSLTDNGLGKVKANSGGILALDVRTTIKAGADIDNGIIPNQAFLNTTINDNETSRIPSTEPETYWGHAKVIKVDGTNDETLEGAKFRIYDNETDALADNDDNALVVPGAAADKTLTTGANGELTFGPLNATEAGKTYYLVEVQAPAGYQLPEAAADRVHEAKVTAGTTIAVTVDNNKQPNFELPLTGAGGTTMFILGGLALVAIAVGAVLRNRRAHA
ncbi:MAG: SpaH/EbpB family LPXTG-anchored major pilin [Gulosibacter sp.]|uniref:SpaH/EbpB family LPXTG-anchored major pilin n=1 Tax=Gulosibacter sp. TaxID=2817531 RepID=UPI003F8D91A9